MRRRTVTVVPGAAVDLGDPAWAGALVLVRDGALDVTDLAGRCFRFEPGALLVLAGVDVARAVGAGPGPTVLVGVRRPSQAAAAGGGSR